MDLDKISAAALAADGEEDWSDDDGEAGVTADVKDASAPLLSETGAASALTVEDYVQEQKRPDGSAAAARREERPGGRAESYTFWWEVQAAGETMPGPDVLRGDVRP